MYEQLLSSSCAHHEHDKNLIDNDYSTASNYEEIAKRVLKERFKQKFNFKPNDELFKINQEQLTNAIDQGWDNRLGFGSTEVRKLQMYSNVHLYAAFKNHDNMLEIASLLFDKEGNERTFNEFYKVAKGSLDKYNKTWLKAEFTLARQSARSAAQWQRLSSKGGTLIYKTIGDGAVRDSHQLLNNTQLPASDPFWNSYYPPNGWGCRCFVRHTTSTEEVQPSGLPDDLPEMFKNNVGKTGEVFSKEHPIRKSLNEEQLKEVKTYALGQGSAFERRFIQNRAPKFLKGKSFTAQVVNEEITVLTNKKSANHLVNGRNYHRPSDGADLIGWTTNKNRLLATPEKFWENVIELPPAKDLKNNPMVKGYRYFKTEVEGEIYFLEVRIMNNDELVWYNINNEIRNDM